MKRFIFFILSPLYLSLTIFMLVAYKWWVKLMDNHQFVFIMLIPFFLPITMFYYATYEWWMNLVNDTVIKYLWDALPESND